MDTDYDTYAIIYSCKGSRSPYDKQNNKKDFVWLLTRTPEVDPRIYSHFKALVEREVPGYDVAADMRKVGQGS
jgi:lipocalin